MQRAATFASVALRRLAAPSRPALVAAANPMRPAAPAAGAPSRRLLQPTAVFVIRRCYAARGGGRKVKAVSEDDEEELGEETLGSDMEDFDDEDLEDFDDGEEFKDFDDEDDEVETKRGRR